MITLVVFFFYVKTVCHVIIFYLVGDLIDIHVEMIE